MASHNISIHRYFIWNKKKIVVNIQTSKSIKFIFIGVHLHYKIKRIKSQISQLNRIFFVILYIKYQLIMKKI